MHVNGKVQEPGSSVCCVCVCVCGFVWDRGRGVRLQKDTNSVEMKDNLTRFTTVALLFERFYLQSPCFKVQNVIQSTYL